MAAELISPAKEKCQHQLQKAFEDSTMFKSLSLDAVPAG
jgi:hypothetical protein